ncbi:transposase [Microbulbifer taiwanensis]|uniref:Transposase n=1 Tax=Microbulbifer taiwanensis TaxID=986746 RepID=A0ABW1YSQ8_9GAMM|nr:transposase [Microbulbifer taiwanensis]
MPRKARILLANMPHHIVQRGHNREPVFLADEDYQYYRDNLFEWKEKLDIRLYAWCLMTNHVHLLVEPGDRPETVSLLMKRLAGRQAAYVNKLEGRRGSLWEGRFKASVVQAESYFLACCRYIELNPVRAGMVRGPRQYKWSSYRARIGVEKGLELDGHEELRRLGRNGEQGVAAYKEFIKAGVPADELAFLSEAWSRNQLTGNRRFVDEIERRVGLRIEHRRPGRPRVGDE